MVIFTQATAISSFWAIIFPGMLLWGFGFGAIAGVASAMVSISY
jgi:hypothetical protein